MTDHSTLVLVVCAAPPAAAVHELAALLKRQDWDVHAVVTDAAAEWVDHEQLQAATSHPVRTRSRLPEEEKLTPRPDCVVLAPATFNTINQWVAGVNNTAALGILNEALGARIPIVASPYVKPALAAHPTFVQNLRFLHDNGVRLTETDALKPENPAEPFRWGQILDWMPHNTR